MIHRKVFTKKECNDIVNGKYRINKHFFFEISGLIIKCIYRIIDSYCQLFAISYQLLIIHFFKILPILTLAVSKNYFYEKLR